MNYHDMRRYLGLDVAEFDMLLLSAKPGQVDAWADMAEVSDNLEQLPSRYNRPPETAEDDPVHDALDDISKAAFARLEALIKEHEEFRRPRADVSSGRRRGVGRRSVPDMGKHCATIGLHLATKAKNLGQRRST